MTNERFDRNTAFFRLFGKDGQRQLLSSSAAVVGVGGLGTHVVQQLAHLGVGHLTLIDSEELDETNRNRYVGVQHTDPIPGTLKVDIGARMVAEIDPAIDARPISRLLCTPEAFDGIKESAFVFGCLDNEGSRFILNELCAAYEKPYIDLASGIESDEPPTYGGQVCTSWDGLGCLYCHALLDMAEVQIDLEDEDARRTREDIYGVQPELLERSGPSVVSINGVVASLGVTEFMLLATGLRAPRRVLHYRGNQGIVTVQPEPPELNASCYYCKQVRGMREAADVERYLQ